MRGEGDGPWRPEGHEQRDDDLRLADRETPQDRQGEHPEDDQCSAVQTQPDDREGEADHEERLPDGGRDLERQQRERAEHDRQQRRIAIELVVVGRRRLVVQRQARVEARTRVVVGVDVGEGVRRQVEDERLDAQRQPEDGRAGEDAADVRSVERGKPAGRGHGDHPSDRTGGSRPPAGCRRIANSYRSEWAGGGATLHRPCEPRSPCTCSPSRSGWY